MKKNLILLTFTFLTSFLQAQDSSRLRISLLTCTPGEELYSIFGHSALRVIDSNNVTDRVFNYGTFNFEDEGFYLKFIRGKLLYYISIEEFRDFQFAYQAMGRGMTEQELQLTAVEKINVKTALFENLREENKYYKYDFFFDNCTTRLRDLILKFKQPAPALPAVMPANTRFREAIHAYLNEGKQYWSKLGIDILLGAPTDRVMKITEQQFLPDNLMKAFDSCTNVSLVSNSKNLYPLPEKTAGSGWFTPLVFFWALFSIVVLSSTLKNSTVQNILIRFDGFIFFTTGFLGIIIVFMWTSTDHSMTKNNFNLLWALPSHAIAAFWVNGRKKWSRHYFLLTAILSVLLLLSWFFLPQQMNNALIPFVLMLAYRAMTIYNKQHGD